MYPLGFSGVAVTYVMEVRIRVGPPHDGQNRFSGFLQILEKGKGRMGDDGKKTSKVIESGQNKRVGKR